MFFSNATTTAVQELAFGTSGNVLTSNGATSAPTWSAIPVPTSISTQGAITLDAGDGITLTGQDPVLIDNVSLNFKSGATTYNAFNSTGEYLLHFAKS
jgi:hypothetical protein